MAVLALNEEIREFQRFFAIFTQVLAVFSEI